MAQPTATHAERSTKGFTDKFANMIVPNFATPEECQALIRQTQNEDHAKLAEATVGSDRRKDAKVRNNTTAFVKKLDVPDSPEGILRRRVDELIQSRSQSNYNPDPNADTDEDSKDNKNTINDTAMSEPVQVQIYKPGQHYSKHTDSWDNHAVCNDKTKQRTWTCVLYLNDVEAGGTTTFPQIGTTLHRPSDPTRAPEQGTLACWYNVLPNLEANKLTEHQGDPVVRGEKYLANFWYQTNDKPQACKNSTGKTETQQGKRGIDRFLDGIHSSAGRTAWGIITGLLLLTIALLWLRDRRRAQANTNTKTPPGRKRGRR